MKSFFKIIFGSCLGVILALITFFGIIAIIVGVSASKLESKDVDIEPNSVLHVNLSGFIPEKTNNVEPEFRFDEIDAKHWGIHDLVRAIEKAKKDKDIKGITISHKAPNLGLVKASLLRDALEDFKSAGKFVYSYGDSYSSSSYFLASVSDKIILHPMGNIDLRGPGVITEYYTGLLDKLDIDVEVYYAGKFKSATEPYRRTNMSDENRQQLRQLLTQRYTYQMEEISADRELSIDALKTAINEFAGSSAPSALSAQLIDEIGYPDQLIDILRKDLDYDEDEELEIISLSDYTSTLSDDKDYSIKEKIAVIYAEGIIGGEEEQYGRITQDPYIETIRDIRKNDNIKAIVLRVDSRGGSALLSDKIWRELKLCQDEGKPVVVSMGNYAASGGYYIACASDKIFVDANTITGSIGVYGMLINLKEFYNEKLGITFDTTSLATYATDFTAVDERSNAERTIIQNQIDLIYNEFLNRVSNNRDLSREQIESLAQGRVWTGKDAVENGLADKIGTLSDAIAAAAELSDLDEYRISEYPKLKEPFQRIIEDITGQEQAQLQKISNQITKEIPLLGELTRIQELTQAPQARLIFDIEE